MAEWHRFEDGLTAPPLDEFDNPCGEAQLHVYHRRYKLLKETPKGVWLDLGWGEKRFVLSEARKRFACATVEEALESFKARKEKQIRIYEKRVSRAREAIGMATRMAGRISSANNGPTVYPAHLLQ